jgi:predicted ribosomally synthesized peptide with SipW-like signal peptide
MKKIAGLALGLILLMGVIAMSVYAFYTDREASASNLFQAGTLDLKTNNNDGVSQVLYAMVLQAGESRGPATIQLLNSGTVNGTTLNIAFAYTESDGSPNSVNLTADQTAADIEVTGLNYGGSSLLNSVSDLNSNGYKDIQDLKNTTFNGLTGINAGDNKSFDITIQLKSATGVDYQDDGIDINITFTLSQ